MVPTRYFPMAHPSATVQKSAWKDLQEAVHAPFDVVNCAIKLRHCQQATWYNRSRGIYLTAPCGVYHVPSIDKKNGRENQPIGGWDLLVLILFHRKEAGRRVWHFALPLCHSISATLSRTWASVLITSISDTGMDGAYK